MVGAFGILGESYLANAVERWGHSGKNVARRGLTLFMHVHIYTLSNLFLTGGRGWSTVEIGADDGIHYSTVVDDTQVPFWLVSFSDAIRSRSLILRIEGPWYRTECHQEQRPEGPAWVVPSGVGSVGLVVRLLARSPIRIRNVPLRAFCVTVIPFSLQCLQCIMQIRVSIAVLRVQGYST